MKKDEIKIGATYTAKVSDRVVPIRIDRENARGGWDATNLVTNKQVRIKSAQRLRGTAERSFGEAKGTPTAKAPEKAQKIAKPTKTTTLDAGGGIMVDVVESKAAEAPKAKKVSGLDAAYELLTRNIEPMRCGDIIDQLIENKMWQTNGKTPEGTLHSAMAREIKTKGDASRFKKTDRGLFTINDGK